MTRIRCTSCTGIDSQYRYVKMYDTRFNVEGWMCAQCFDEWLGIEKSRQRERFRMMQHDTR